MFLFQSSYVFFVPGYIDWFAFYKQNFFLAFVELIFFFNLMLDMMCRILGTKENVIFACKWASLYLGC